MRTVLVSALLAAVAVIPHTASADVEISGATTCFDHAKLRSRLSSIVAMQRPAGRGEPLVTVSASDGADATTVELAVVMPGGDRALERRYELSAADCGSAEDLIAAVVLRFMEDLPAHSWPEPEPAVAQREDQAAAEGSTGPEPAEDGDASNLDAASPPAPRASALRGIEFLATLGGYAAMLPLDRGAAGSPRPSFEAELGAGAALLTARHGFSLLGVLRSGTQVSLGPGTYRNAAALAELGWTWRDDLRIGAALRGGASRMAGAGFDENSTAWLWWLEAGGTVGYRWRRTSLVGRVWLSPVRHEVVTTDREHSVVAPRLRVGIAIQQSFGGEIP